MQDKYHRIDKIGYGVVNLTQADCFDNDLVEILTIEQSENQWKIVHQPIRGTATGKRAEENISFIQFLGEPVPVS